MVQITSRPLKEFIVYKHLKFRGVGELARRAVIEGSPMQPAHLKWINGIIYRTIYPAASVMSETLAKEFTDGKIWVEVEYADMPQFKGTVNTSEENVIVPVVDNSIDREERELIEWLKKLPPSTGPAS
ncbi:MAG: hypothetical protein FJ358_03580 [Thaumarchaeota archaeon]|nr:hypothetical protein [Nitrososphaerota archaeon]